MATLKFRGSDPIGFDNVNLTGNDVSALFKVGSRVYDIYDNCYMYVKNAHTAALAAGNAVTVNLASANNTESAIEVIGPTTATLNLFAGIAMGAITAAYYGWIQVEGWNKETIATAGAVVAGSSLKCANGVFTMATDQVIGTESTYQATAISTAALAGAGNLTAGQVYIKSILA